MESIKRTVTNLETYPKVYIVARLIDKRIILPNLN
jgi:hypothetical protein